MRETSANGTFDLDAEAPGETDGQTGERQRNSVRDRVGERGRERVVKRRRGGGVV